MFFGLVFVFIYFLKNIYHIQYIYMGVFGVCAYLGATFEHPMYK